MSSPNLPVRSSHPVPLRLLLVLPFVAQVFAAVGLVGYLSFRNGQQAVQDLSSKLRQEVSQRIDAHLTSYMETPRQLTQLNAEAINLGTLNLSDRNRLQQYFWQQVNAFNIGFALYGAPSGDFESAGYVFEDRITIGEVNPAKHGTPNLYIWEADQQGRRTSQLVGDFGAYPFQQELWYSEALKKRQFTWTPVYNWQAAPFSLAISAAAPLYGRNQQDSNQPDPNQLLGVVAIEQQLSQVSDFLRQQKISPASETFIIERSGLLVGSSVAEPPFRVIDGKPQRLQASESSDRLIQATAQYLTRHFTSLEQIQQSQQLDFRLDQQRHFVQVTPWRDAAGIDWLIVVAMPESDFMAQINANTRTTILLCLGALAGAILIGLYTSRWIAQPIQRLAQTSQAIAAGNLDQQVETFSLRELNHLGLAFNQMASQLRQSFSALEQANSQLEDRVNERTQELQQTLQNLHQTQSQMLQSEKMSALGQMVAGVAHEINNPVNFIHGNLAHVTQYSQDMLGLLRLYAQHFPNPPAEIAAEIEAIDLAFVAEDLIKVLQSMQVGTGRIREIVLSLRNFSRLDEAEFKPANIHAGIDSTLLLLQHRLKATPQRSEILVQKTYGELPEIECYPGQLNQVFMNILANAIDAVIDKSQEHKPELTPDAPSPAASSPQITIRTSRMSDNWVKISIADTGTGIPEAIASRIFDPFFTTKPVGKGTGMGMAISYQIITEQHGGRLTCISIPEQGAEFVIELPICQTSEAAL